MSELSGLIRKEPRMNDDGGLTVLTVGVICLLAGMALGMFTQKNFGSTTELDKAKAALTELKGDFPRATENAWTDGVMWGSLAMKHITDRKQPDNDFNVVLGQARELKVLFVNEQKGKNGNGR
jgi:hypothetical protein